MKDEHEEGAPYFSRLPANLIKSKIFPKLEKKDQLSVARTDRRNFGIFVDFLFTQQLGLLVAQGNLVAIKKLIKQLMRHPKLCLGSIVDVALQSVSVVDYSERKFPSISALKLAHWIGDSYIQEILLSYLQKELKVKARKQIQEIKLDGIDYGYDLLLDGKVTCEMIEKQGAAILDGRTAVILRGIELIMLTLSEEEKIDEKYLREISEKYYERPILVRQGDKKYLYGFTYDDATIEKIHRKWCISELKHPGFSNLSFPRGFRDPKLRYLPLRKASETLTEAMWGEIVEIHGGVPYPYSFILMSLPEGEEIGECEITEEELDKMELKKKERDEKEFTRIAAENPNQPILVRQGQAIFLYEFRNKLWLPIKLNDAGFQDLAFPKEGFCSLKLPTRKSNETITQEMRQEMASVHNFVDYKVKFLDFEETETGIKTKVHVEVLGERRFDYYPLIEALKDFVEIHKLWELEGFSEGALKKAVDHQWCEVVRLVQYYATAFLAQQYCHHNRQFDVDPTFYLGFEGKDRCLYFVDNRNDENDENKEVFWFDKSVNVGIIRAGGYDCARAGNPAMEYDLVSIDLRAVETLRRECNQRLVIIEKGYLDDDAPSQSFRI